MFVVLIAFYCQCAVQFSKLFPKYQKEVLSFLAAIAFYNLPLYKFQRGCIVIIQQIIRTSIVIFIVLSIGCCRSFLQPSKLFSKCQGQLQTLYNEFVVLFIGCYQCFLQPSELFPNCQEEVQTLYHHQLSLTVRLTTFLL